MAAARRAVRQADHGMDVQAGLAVVAGGDIAHEAQRLALLVDLDRPVGLLLDVEPSDRAAFEGTQRRQRGSGEAVFGRETSDHGEGFLSRIEHEDEGAVPGIRQDELGVHRVPRGLSVALPDRWYWHWP